MEDRDQLTNTFSEDGRILQVEYAIKSVASAGLAIGVRFRNGVFLLGKSADGGVSLTQDEKIYRINDQTIAIVGGLYADSNILVNYARHEAQEHLLEYDQEMAPKQVAKKICKVKQRFTHGGGMRPFGVSFIIGGRGARGEYRLYGTDPSGTLTEWRAHAFGHGEQQIEPVLDTLPEPCEKEEAIACAFKALAATSEGAPKSSHAVSGMVMYYSEQARAHRTEELSQESIRRHLAAVKAK